MPAKVKNYNTFWFPLHQEIDEFLLDRRARGLTKKTLLYYRHGLTLFRDFLATQGVKTTADVLPNHIRLFLVHLEEMGKGEGGCVNVYGAVRSFLYWFGAEYAPATWKNPIQDKRMLLGSYAILSSV